MDPRQPNPKTQEPSERHIKQSQRLAIIARRVVNFAKVHRRVAAVTGALIVFLTFVVKDAVREQVKDLVDSLQSAEDVFEIRAQHEVTVALLNGIGQRVQLIWQSTPEAKEFLRKNDKSGVIHDITENADIIEQERANLDNLQRFIARLPSSETGLRAEVSEIRKRWTEHHDFYLQVIAMINQKQMSEDQEFDAMSTLGPESEDLNSAILDLSERAIAKSDTLREDAEKRLQIYTWASYVLYTVGWSLALFGRIFEVGDLPEPG